MSDVKIRKVSEMLNPRVQWKREGACDQARCGGACCEYMIFWLNPEQCPPDTQRWYELHGCKVDRLSAKMVAVHVPIPCTKLVDGKCSIYEDRPEMCRNYPQHPLEQLGLDCGFSFKRG